MEHWRIQGADTTMPFKPWMGPTYRLAPPKKTKVSYRKSAINFQICIQHVVKMVCKSQIFQRFRAALLFSKSHNGYFAVCRFYTGSSLMRLEPVWPFKPFWVGPSTFEKTQAEWDQIASSRPSPPMLL